MRELSRRNLLQSIASAVGAGVTLSALPPSIRDALAVEPRRDTGTIQDVAHIVVLTQENRSFDHYFGAMRGVRGFSDRFAVPVAAHGTGKPESVFQQPAVGAKASDATVLPFHLDTLQNFNLMRAEGTPHSWLDAQQAWDHGRMRRWTHAKGLHAMAYYTEADLPFHYALADAFTVCDAYHCAFQGGTNTNRLFLWTGTNDPGGIGHGPATYNDLDSLHSSPNVPSYTWTTYPERLQAAGITWQVYQDMADNYDDNPLAGFRSFRDAHAGLPGVVAELKLRGLTTRDLKQLRADVQANALPQVSWIVAGAQDSEHPEKSSPAQGAHFTARVLEALTSNPDVWSRTVFILNFDENDGYFDHMPPPAVPSYRTWHEDPAKAVLAGGSTVATRGEYHEKLPGYRNTAAEQGMLHAAYGLGPRVPMLVISPWSRGGWVNSQVFDHTSVIRFMEQRFGVVEPNISAWRRAVCGDLTSALDFARPDLSKLPVWPDTLAPALRAAALPGRTRPNPPLVLERPRQAAGTRPSRALPYQLKVDAVVSAKRRTLALTFSNAGSAAAVFHAYDRLDLSQIPRRYTVEGGRQLADVWPLEKPGAAYDVWVLGPNGFHRHFTGNLAALAPARAPWPEIEVGYSPTTGALDVQLRNAGHAGCSFIFQANAYGTTLPVRCFLRPHQESSIRWPIEPSGCWYDLSLQVPELPGFSRRFAGRMETGLVSISDPDIGSH